MSNTASKAHHGNSLSAVTKHCLEIEETICNARGYAAALALMGTSDELRRTSAGRAVLQVATDLEDSLESIKQWFDDLFKKSRGDRDDDGNGEVEESAGDAKASSGSDTASAINDHLDAVEDFAETLVVSVAPSVELHDKVLGASVHRLAREIVSRLEAIQELRSGSPAAGTQ